VTIEATLRDHLRRYPALQIPDLYKLIHQASFGSEHALANPERARAWLAQEAAEMGPGPDEPLLDPLSDEIVRVHLRPYQAAGGAWEPLFAAFARTANEYRGSAQVFEQSWQAVGRLSPFTAADLDAYARVRAGQGYPAVHHSDAYVELYRPAYRVVWNQLLPATAWSGGERSQAWPAGWEA
jgi:hypothetical protein